MTSSKNSRSCINAFIMNEELLNNQLYESLCASVLKWFEKDRGYEVEIKITKDTGWKSIVFPEVVIGGSRSDATLEVSIIDETYLYPDSIRCHMGITLVFNAAILLTEEEKTNSFIFYVLDVINKYNAHCQERCIYYDDSLNRIEIYQNFYFYPGTMVSDEDIAKILDNFYFNRDIEDITELVESGGWMSPELYIEPRIIGRSSATGDTKVENESNPHMPF